MAITSAGVGTKATTDSGTTITLNAPASPASDDVWIAVVCGEDGFTHTFTDWSNIVNTDGPSSNLHLSVWYFRYAGATPNLIATNHSASTSAIAGIASFRGVKTSGSPVNVTGAVTDQGTSSATIAHVGVTITATSALLVINGAFDDTTRTALGGDYTSAFSEAGSNSYAGNLAQDLSIALSYDLSATGATSNPINQTQSLSRDYMSVLVALEEDAGGAPAGWPSQYNDGGVRFSESNDRHWEGRKLWRRALNGLYLPKPRFA